MLYGSQTVLVASSTKPLCGRNKGAPYMRGPKQVKGTRFDHDLDKRVTVNLSRLSRLSVSRVGVTSKKVR